MKFIVILVILVNSIFDLNCESHKRIRGGENIDIKDVPYQVSIRIRKGTMNHHCGGSILDERYVLTAAHCLNPLKNSSNLYMSVRIGSSFREKEGVEKRPEAYIVHPQFDNYELDYDFAIIKVESDIEFGPVVAPVRLPTKVEDFDDGFEFYIAGWGQTGEPGPRHLKGLKVEKLNIKNCSDYWSLTDRMLCVAPQMDGVTVGTGKGDSGGGLVAVKSRTVTLLKTIHGVSSFGHVGKPTGFARVSVVLDWINGVLDGTIPLTPL